MAMFGNGNSEQLQALDAEVRKLREANKAGFAQLAEMRARCVQLEAEAQCLQAALAAAQASTKRVRARQKNSVERANRLKMKLLKASPACKE